MSAFHSRVLGITEVHSEKGRLLVTITAAFSARSLTCLRSGGSALAKAWSTIRRCRPLELPKRMLVPDERVMVIDGPFREFEAIFERYLSGQERVAILFSMMGSGARAVLPASMVVPVV